MKPISWNVNGIRACIGKGFWEWYKKSNADVVCLQETKITAKDFVPIVLQNKLVPLTDLPIPLEFAENLAPQKNTTCVAIAPAERAGYSGVAMLFKNKPNKIEVGLGEPKFDCEGRTLFAYFDDLVVVTSYTPNGGEDLSRIPYKLEYADCLLKKLEKIRKHHPHIAICGDLNVAHQEIDIKNPKANMNNSGFTPQERQWFQKFLDHGYIDTFRHLHPEARDAYSWWSYRFSSRLKNIGWRIDYFVVTQEMQDRLKEASIQKEQQGSDHCPVILKLF